MAAPLSYLLGCSVFSCLCGIYTSYWAFNRHIPVLYVGYMTTACFALTLTTLGVCLVALNNTNVEPAISALVCLIVGANTFLQSQHLNCAMNKGLSYRFLLEDFRVRCFPGGLDLPFRQHVFMNACFSVAAACGKFVVALMIMFGARSFPALVQAKLTLGRVSHKSDTLSVISLFGASLEYSILAVMLFHWTFSEMGYAALLNHFGSFAFATVGLLALAILASLHQGTAAFSLYTWTGLPFTSVIQRVSCPLHEGSPPFVHMVWG